MRVLPLFNCTLSQQPTEPHMFYISSCCASSSTYQNSATATPIWTPRKSFLLSPSVNILNWTRSTSTQPEREPMRWTPVIFRYYMLVLSLLVSSVFLFPCFERIGRSVMVVMVVMVVVVLVYCGRFRLCVFVPCAKRRHPPKTRVSADTSTTANSSQCVLLNYMFWNKIWTNKVVSILAQACL